MDIKNKIKNRFRKKRNFGLKSKGEKSVEVPKSWQKEMSKPRTSTELRYERKKIHVPALRPMKRFIAALLCIFYFVTSQLTLMSNPGTQWMAVPFGLTAFLLADYLWKTRGGR